MFNSFMFQTCDSSKAARKILEAKGVAHFWDQSLAFLKGKNEKFQFKLGSSRMNDEKIMQNDDLEEEEDGDIVMKEAF